MRLGVMKVLQLVGEMKDETTESKDVGKVE